MEKRGQFFLIAALVIVAILFGLGSILVSIKTQREDKRDFDLSKEIKVEASRVIDNGVFLAKTEEKISENVENLTNFYATSNPSSDLVFIYGNQTILYILYYNNTVTGTVGISTGSTPTTLQVVERNKQKSKVTSQTETVMVTLANNIKYNFDLNLGQNFFLVIKKDRQNERIITT